MVCGSVWGSGIGLVDNGWWLVVGMCGPRESPCPSLCVGMYIDTCRVCLVAVGSREVGKGQETLGIYTV